MRRLVLVTVSAALTLLPRAAAAQGFISPFIGTTLTSPSPTGSTSTSKPGFGIAFGGFGKIVGGETEIAYYPEVLDNTTSGLSKNKVITFSGNTLIGPTIGPVKVYGAVGVGDVYLNVTSVASVVVPNPSSISNNYFAFNVGGGVAGFFGHHLGARGDLRYYRAFGFNETDLTGASPTLTLTHFDFWRAYGALVVTF